MGWFLLVVISVLLFGYFYRHGNETTTKIDTEKIDHFVVTAILSTLVAHGVISLLDQSKLEDLSLGELQEHFVKNNLLSETEWKDMVHDHLYDHSIYSEAKDLDFG